MCFLNALLLNILSGCLGEERVKEAVQHPLPRHLMREAAVNAMLSPEHTRTASKKKFSATVFSAVLSGKEKLNWCQLAPWSWWVHRMAWGGNCELKRARSLILPPETPVWVITAPLFRGEAWPASQQLHTLCFFKSLTLHKYFALQQAQL